MQYESEKIARNRLNVQGKNQYSILEGEKTDTGENDFLQKSCRHITAQRIAEENNISGCTVLKYATYTRALEEIGQKAPEIVPKILSGRCKISHKKAVELSQLTPDEIKRIGRKIERSQQPFIQYSKTRQEIEQSAEQINSVEALPIPSVKDMPVFDPDAEITALTLTIPSWSSSIDRTRTKADLNIVSNHAKGKLKEVLIVLQDKITNILLAIKEGNE
jgi:hypothetical protein